jgi:hypothetical protein
MSKQSDENLRGIPMKSYDLIREGLIVLGVIFVLVLVLAIAFGSPDYPTVKAQDVANLQPIAYLEASAEILGGSSSVESYGPPYTNDTENAQNLLGVAPSRLLGVTNPLSASQDLIIAPLQKAAVIDPAISTALSTYQAASSGQQQTWVNKYFAGLSKASVNNGQVGLPVGDYGPVEAMMNGMLALGKAGLLEGALANSSQLPYNMDYTNALLFFQDDIDHSVAEKLDVLGSTWGISNETGPFPGAWWTYPYTFLYQIPPMNSSPNGDLEVVAIMTVLILILLFVPFIPIINRIPKWVGLYRIIWRDWYKHYEGKL